MAGDSVLAVFGTTIGAMSAALAVQRDLDDARSVLPEDRQMRFRIGVHLGNVIEKDDGTVYGDGVTLPRACRRWPGSAQSRCPTRYRARCAAG